MNIKHCILVPRIYTYTAQASSPPPSGSSLPRPQFPSTADDLALVSLVDTNDDGVVSLVWLEGDLFCEASAQTPRNSQKLENEREDRGCEEEAARAVALASLA